MSGNKRPKLPKKNAAPPPEKVEEKPAEKPSEEEQFHPHKHGHVAIATPDTAVTHLDPGAITFS